MKLGVAQLAPVVGDLEGNVDRAEAAAIEAAVSGAELVVLPEMAVPGYPPRDILNDPGFVRACAAATGDLARRCEGLPPVLVGTVARADRHRPRHPSLHNVAALLIGGRVQRLVAKRLLPTVDVFHESRWFLPGPASPPLQVAGASVGVLVCEDLWDGGGADRPSRSLREAGAELLVVPSASPYRLGALDRRLHHARRHGLPVALVNMAGATDELVFDGRSFVLDAAGRELARLAAFDEEVRVVDLEAGTAESAKELAEEEELYLALVRGVRDFHRRNGLSRAVLGLSGGVDSAVVACLAAEALGAEGVAAVAIPSRFTDARSTMAAAELASLLGIAFEVVELEPLHRQAEVVLGHLPGTAAENLQARLRMTVLMARVNAGGGTLLNASNKTELSLGYATLYGDMAGALCPIADLTKTRVRALARWIAEHRVAIPDFILTRPPTAELAAGQTDPFDYDEVAPRLESLVLADRSDDALRRSEHKRWQMGVILKVTDRAFGTGRLIPITRR